MLTLLIVLSLSVLLLCYQIIDMQKSIVELYEIQLENNTMLNLFKMLLGGGLGPSV